MNLIDYGILAVIGASVVVGLYRGFMRTGISLVALAFSLMLAQLCTPLVSAWIGSHKSWMDMLIYFSEGTSHIPTALMEYVRADVVSLSAGQIQEVIGSSGFSAPFDQYLIANISGQVYFGRFTTLFDYINQTVADASLNTFSFLLSLAFTYLVSSILIGLVDSTFQFPLLRQLDSVAGGALGLARGFVLMMALALLVPLVLNMLQIGMIKDLVEGSKLLGRFYPGNWFTSWISPIV